MGLQRQLDMITAKERELSDEQDAILDLAERENRELTDEDNKRINALGDELKKNIESQATLRKQLEIRNARAQSRAETELMKGNSPSSVPIERLPARAKSVRSRVFETSYDAYACGQWIRSLGGNARAAEWCRTNGIMGAMTEGTDADGGYAVPDPMAATIIRLVEDYGVFRRNARNIPMTSDTLAVPKRSAGLTMYYPAEGAAITASDLTFAQVALTAVKYAQLAIMSTELSEDAIISMTDLITTELAYNFGLAEDTNSFLGDGTGTYGSITGIKSALAAGAKVTRTATTVSWSDLTIDDFHAMQAKLPQYAGMRPKWYINSYGYYGKVVDLLLGLGGTDMRQAEQGGGMMLLGSPVEFTQVLPGSDADAGDMVAVYGDLGMGAILGTRRNVTIRVLNELYAANDQIGLVATMRSDSVIHDVGTASVAGSIVGLFIADA